MYKIVCRNQEKDFQEFVCGDLPIKNIQDIAKKVSEEHNNKPVEIYILTETLIDVVSAATPIKS